MTLFQPRSRITANKPRLLPKCFISCDSLVPASRAIVTVLVFSYPLCANRRFAAMRIRSWDEIGGMDLTLFVSGIGILVKVTRLSGGSCGSHDPRAGRGGPICQATSV